MFEIPSKKINSRPSNKNKTLFNRTDLHSPNDDDDDDDEDAY